MKLPFLTLGRLLLPLAVCGFFFTNLSRCPAADDPYGSALSASQAWLALIDAGKYDAAYVAGGQGLHDKEPQNRWELVLKYLRPPWGKLVSRKPNKHDYQPNGIQGLNGECMIITYDTSFDKLTEAWEMVILRYEDGKWRGVGYTAGPRPNPNGSQFIPQDSASETTSTVVHPKPK